MWFDAIPLHACLSKSALVGDFIAGHRHCGQHFRRASMWNNLFGNQIPTCFKAHKFVVLAMC